MYDAETQKAKVKILYPEAEDAKIELQLEFAKDFINERRGFTPTDLIPMEDKYLNLQIQMTIEALSKEGAEGERTHNDNGVMRSYENGSPYSNTLVNRIIPLAKSLT